MIYIANITMTTFCTIRIVALLQKKVIKWHRTKIYGEVGASFMYSLNANERSMARKVIGMKNHAIK